MVTITGTYEGELRCTSRHGPSRATLTTDAPADNEGKGRAFSPTDLVATALATCMVTTMGIWSRRHDVAFAGASFTVTKEMATTTPRRIARLSVAIRVPGTFDADARSRLEHVARACPVHQSLHPSIALDVTFDWTGVGIGGEGLEPATSSV